jgi:hypothetical protein
VSHVADVLLWTSVLEEPDDPPVRAVNAYLASLDHAPLVEITDYVRGKKAVQSYWYAGAANYLDIPQLVAIVQAQEWQDPESVVLLIKDEHDERGPKMYRADEGSQ